MSRASSSRVAIESRMPRINCADIAMRPTRLPRIAAIGASSTGGRSTARPGSARRKLLTQAISGRSRTTWRNDRMMPIASTPRISALRPGLARNATWICLCSRNATSAQRTTNTSIRNRKMRGEESLSGSVSDAIWFCGRCEAFAQYATVREQGKIGRPALRIMRQIELKLRPGSAGFSGLVRDLERAQHFAVDDLVARDDMALVQDGVATIEIGDKAARLAHQDDARRHIPGRYIALPIAVEAPGGDPGEIERGGAELAQAAG